MKLDEIIEVVLESFSEILKQDKIEDIKINRKTEIFGQKSILDSLQLVNLIVKIEEVIFEKTGKEIVIVDEASIIVGDSPFQTVQSLSEFVYKKVESA